MKRVLFVGDGKHDIGAPEWPTDQPYPARGVVPHLVERTAEIDRTNSRALRWSEVTRLSPTKKGYEHKLRAAQLLAVRHGLDAVVAVVNADNDPTRHELIDTALTAPTASSCARTSPPPPTSRSSASTAPQASLPSPTLCAPTSAPTPRPRDSVISLPPAWSPSPRTSRAATTPPTTC